MNSTVTTNALARLSVAREVCFSPATNEGCIVLNLERGTVLSLNETGALMFSKLAASKTGLTRDELVGAVAAEFENVEPSRVERAVNDLLARLEKTGTLRSELAVGPPSKALRTRFARRVPICVRYMLIPLLFFNAYTLAALILLLTAEAVRKLGGFHSMHRIVQQWRLGTKRQSRDAMIAKVCSAVDRACTWHPKRALCLQRASVTVCLLRSLGLPAEMIIGVHKMPFYGHAWAELDGQVVNDHANAQNFFHVLSRC